MSIVNRVKNILLSPAQEWQVIESESETPSTLLRKYVLPLALIAALAQLIGFGLIGVNAVFMRFSSLELGIYLAVQSLLVSIIGYYVSTYVVDALAPNFASPRDLGRSAQLVAYSHTAFWVVSIFCIIPALSWLRFLGLYGIVLFYLGLPVMKKTPEEQRIIYMIVSALVIILVSYVINYILSMIYFQIAGNPFGFGAGRWF